MSDSVGEAAAPGLWRRFLDFVDWKINPVLLRDLRLYMRGKLMLAAYFLTLAVLVLLAVLYIIIARFEGTDGTQLLGLLTGLLTIICGAMIPNLVFERFRAELSNRATELALTSPLTPAQLVRGKLLGSWCMTFMVVSAAAPMLATSYLLGGINLISLVGVVVGVMVAGMTVPMLQLSMAADFKGGKGMSRGLAALLFVVELVMMIYYATLLYGAFVRSSYRTEQYFPFLLSLVIFAVLVAQFLYFNTVGVLRGEAEDRDVLPRISLAAATYLGSLIAFVLYWYFEGRSGGLPFLDHGDVVAGILCFASYAFCLGFTAVCQSSPVTPRNLADNWRTHPIRSLFLLPGTRSLAAYFLLNMAILLVGIVLAMSLGGRYYGVYDKNWWQMLCVALAPFMAIAQGMVVYRYLVLPLVKEKRNPKLLSHTIGVVSIGVALISGFAMVMVSYVWGEEDLYSFILGVTPVGLVTASIESSANTGIAGMVGIVVMAILGIFLAGMASGSKKAGRPVPVPVTEGGEAAVSPSDDPGNQPFSPEQN